MCCILSCLAAAVSGLLTMHGPLLSDVFEIIELKNKEI